MDITQVNFSSVLESKKFGASNTFPVRFTLDLADPYNNNYIIYIASIMAVDGCDTNVIQCKHNCLVYFYMIPFLPIGSYFKQRNCQQHLVMIRAFLALLNG